MIKKIMDKVAMAELLCMLKLTFENGGVFATCNPKYHKLAQELVDRGLILETTALHMSPGDKDRCYQLTVVGSRESTWLE